MSLIFDHDRARRIGLPEAVFCEGKTAEMLHALLADFARPEAEAILFTRLAPEMLAAAPEAVRGRYDYHPLSRTAFVRPRPARPGRIAIVSAGSSDARVAWEAARTLAYLGIACQMFEDCGVAGLWRLQARLEAIAAADAVIVVAGLDAALASVLGGLLPQPLLAVPTSTGYGAARQGETALNAMLASCAPGIAVFNIDNGYGAACAAARLLHRSSQQP